MSDVRSIASRPLQPKIATAFVGYVLDRAAAADVDLSTEEVQEVRSWFGLP
jgi:hypothetical protein